MSGFTIDRSKTIHVPFRSVAGPVNVADRAGGKKVRTVRKSRFREEGLDDEFIERVDVGSLGEEFAVIGNSLRTRGMRGGTPTTIQASPFSGEKRGNEEPHDALRVADIGKIGIPIIATPNTRTAFSTIPRVALLAFLIGVVVPAFGYTGRQQNNIHVMKGNGADAGVIGASELMDNGGMIDGRANSPTSVCTRWSHMTANVNGTLYIYGGEATTRSGQTTDTWSKSLLT